MRLISRFFEPAGLIIAYNGGISSLVFSSKFVSLYLRDFRQSLIAKAAAGRHAVIVRGSKFLEEIISGLVEKSEDKYISALVARCLDGEKPAWTELIQRITPLVFSICGRMRLSREDGYDVHGQVSYLLWKNLSNLKSTDKLLAYVTTITRRVIYALQQKSKILQKVEEALVENMIVSPPEQPDDIYEDMERREVLMQAIAQLPPREYKLMLTLFFDTSNLSYEEIGQQLGIPVSSIGPSRMRCFKKLYRILKRHELFFKYFS